MPRTHSGGLTTTLLPGTIASPVTMRLCPHDVLPTYQEYEAETTSISPVTRTACRGNSIFGGVRYPLRGDPVRTLSKNFPATHQLDVDLWTEFLHTFCQQNCPFRMVYQ